MTGIGLLNFLAYCLDERRPVPEGMETVDWELMYKFAKQQAIVGVMFVGVQRLKEAGVDIPRSMFLRWFSQVEKISKRNALLNQKAVATAERLMGDGFRCCILKGQGNTLLYPLPYIRTAGDIDVWADGSRDDIVAYVQRNFQKGELRCYHVEYDDEGIPVEVHFMPGIMNNPWYNRRLQRYYQTTKEQQFGHVVDMPDGVGRMPVPTTEFNVVFQLAHMMHHFFDEGIGLRQMIDYYYVLKSLTASHDDYDSLFRRLGLRKFAGAVMFVMNKVLGLDDKYLIVPMDERRGKTLLREILRGGNFGKHSGLTKHSAGEKYFLKHWRSLHFVREYPAEALCEPFFRTWHFFWRLAHR